MGLPTGCINILNLVGNQENSMSSPLSFLCHSATRNFFLASQEKWSRFLFWEAQIPEGTADECKKQLLEKVASLFSDAVQPPTVQIGRRTIDFHPVLDAKEIQAEWLYMGQRQDALDPRMNLPSRLQNLWALYRPLALYLRNSLDPRKERKVEQAIASLEQKWIDRFFLQIPISEPNYYIEEGREINTHDPFFVLSIAHSISRRVLPSKENVHRLLQLGVYRNDPALIRKCLEFDPHLDVSQCYDRAILYRHTNAARALEGAQLSR